MAIDHLSNALNFVVTIKSQEEFDIYEWHMNQKYFVQPWVKYWKFESDENNFYVGQRIWNPHGKYIARISNRTLSEAFPSDKRLTFLQFCERENIRPPKISVSLVWKFVYVKSFDDIIRKYRSPYELDNNTLNNSMWNIDRITIHWINFSRKEITHHACCPVKVISANLVPWTEVITLASWLVLLPDMVTELIPTHWITPSRIIMDDCSGSVKSEIMTEYQAAQVAQKVRYAYTFIPEDTRLIKFSKVL